MAVVQNTLIGRSRNKVGGTVFSTWKGKNVLKSKPLTVANPETDGQLAQRSKMRQLVNLFRFMLMAIRASFKEVSAGSTEWASFMKYNLQNAFTVSGAVATMDYAELAFARGTLINPTDTEIGSITTSGTTITWTDNSGSPGANSSDTILAVAIDDTGEVRLMPATATRSAETVNFEFEPNMNSTAVIIYTWFVSPAQRKSSDSEIIYNAL